MEQIVKDFFAALNSLQTGQRAALKRSVGTMLTGADAKAMAAFYRVLPPGVPQWQESQWFATACFACLWDPAEEDGQPLEQLLAEMIREGSLSDSMQHRVEVLLDTDWDADGYMLTKLSRIIKLVRQKTQTMPDLASLLPDMIYWNQENQRVQKKWASAVFGNGQ